MKFAIYGCSKADTERMLSYLKKIEPNSEVVCFLDSFDRSGGEFFGLPVKHVSACVSVDAVLTPVHKNWSLQALYLLQKYQYKVQPYFENLDWNFVSHRYKIAYKPIPKIAHTSIKNMIYQMEFGQKPLIEEPTKFAPLFTQIFDTNPKFNSDYFYFCVVRDPIKRFKSGYRFVKDVLKMFPEMPDDINCFVENFDDLYLNHYMVTNHFAPQHLFTGRQLDHYDKVVNIDELDSFVHSNSHFKKAGIELPKLNRSDQKQAKKTLNLSHESIGFIQRFYEKDYALLNNYLL